MSKGRPPQANELIERYNYTKHAHEKATDHIIQLNAENQQDGGWFVLNQDGHELVVEARSIGMSGTTRVWREKHSQVTKYE